MSFRGWMGLTDVQEILVWMALQDGLGFPEDQGLKEIAVTQDQRDFLGELVCLDQKESKDHLVLPEDRDLQDQEVIIYVNHNLCLQLLFFEQFPLQQV